MSAEKFPGMWNIAGAFRAEVTEEAMRQILDELRRLREEPVPASELADAERGLAAGFARSLEQPLVSVGHAIDTREYGLPADTWDTYPARVQAVTAVEVQRAARQFLDPATLQVVAVGDATRIKDGLAKFGSVELYNADGKPATGN